MDNPETLALLREIQAELFRMNEKLDRGLSLADNPLIRGAAKAKSSLSAFANGVPRTGK